MLLILYTLLAHILTALFAYLLLFRCRTSASKKLRLNTIQMYLLKKKLRGNCKTEISFNMLSALGIVFPDS